MTKWIELATLISSPIDKSDIRTEDGGCAKIVEVSDGHPQLWCPLTSYIDTLPDMTKPELEQFLAKAHPEIDECIGHRIRITIEIDN